MTHPLAGKRIVITRPEVQSDAFATALREFGAIPIRFPTIQTVPLAYFQALDMALKELSLYDWIVFTSANGVRFVLERMRMLGIAPDSLNQARIAVIGPSTAKALRDQGVRVDLQPDQYVAEALLETLQREGVVNGKLFLLLRAEAARSMLYEELVKGGARVALLNVYRTIGGQPTPDAFEQVRAGVDVVTFTSPLTVRYFGELLPDDARWIAQASVAACIGPITANALTAARLPFRQRIMAAEYTVPGLIDALTDFYRQKAST